MLFINPRDTGHWNSGDHEFRNSKLTWQRIERVMVWIHIKFSLINPDLAEVGMKQNKEKRIPV